MQVQSDFDICGFCEAPASKKCSACKQISYCNFEHQKIHWKVHKLNCKKLFTIIDDPVKGKCMVASRNITQNEIIIYEDPLIIGPRFVSPDPVCLGCHKFIESVTTSTKCAKCSWPLCNPQCSEIKKFHNFECDFLASGKDKINYDYRYELITPLRCLLAKKLDIEKWNAITKMQSHMDQRTPGTEVFKEVDEIFKYLKANFCSDFTKEISEESFHRVCGILDVNSLDVPYDSAELSALYPTFYLLEHNCVPNVKISFNKFKAKVRSAIDINRDAHICTTYTNIIWGTSSRQQHLRSTKYFVCDCKRCIDPTELGTHFSSIKCLQDNCTGFLLPVDPLKEDSSWKCNKCDVMLPETDIAEIISNLTYAVDQILENKYPTIKQVEDLLEKLESLLHPNHYNCFSIKHSLIQLYGKQNGYLHPQLEGNMLNRKIKHCKDLLQILSKLDSSQSRATLYTAVTHYELSAALIEVTRRILEETMNISLAQDNYREVKQLLNKAVVLLHDETNSEMNTQLIQSCKNLFSELENMLNQQLQVIEMY